MTEEEILSQRELILSQIEQLDEQIQTLEDKKDELFLQLPRLPRKPKVEGELTLDDWADRIMPGMLKDVTDRLLEESKFLISLEGGKK